MYIADWGNERVRKVTISTGIITTIAGTGTSSYSGDNGQATSATLNSPTGVRTDTAGTRNSLTYSFYFFLIIFLNHLGNVYIADTFNSRIRKVTVSTGIITTIAGTGTSSFSGDNGPATDATLNYPSSVAFDASGTLFYFFT